MSDADLTHAGGVVYRRRADTGAVEVLIVRARPVPHDWVLPKGHIEPGETPEMCARREVQEEAGVDAEPEGLLGVDRFVGSRGRVVAAFFLMRYVGQTAPTEARETRWVALGEASSFVQFDAMRALLAGAAARLSNA
jgi:ADP-ribose pyrophosphatase YjhB (NUDIX family)